MQAQAIYLAIAIGCAVFYGLSVFFGGDHHHGDFSHHGDGAHHDGDTGFREFFSIRSLLLFGLGFGSTGALSSAFGLPGVLVPIFGSATGILFSYAGIKLFSLLYRQEGTTSNSLVQLEGQIGKIHIAIPEQGIGEVSVCNHRGEAQFVSARSEDGSTILEGESVEVVSVSAGDLVVRRAKVLPPVI